MKLRTAWAMSFRIPRKPAPTLHFRCTPYKAPLALRFFLSLIANHQVPLSHAHNAPHAPSLPHLNPKTGWHPEGATRKRTARAGPECRQEVAPVEQQSYLETGASACGIMTDAYLPLSSISVPKRLRGVYAGRNIGCIPEFVRISEFILRETR